MGLDHYDPDFVSHNMAFDDDDLDLDCRYLGLDRHDMALDIHNPSLVINNPGLDRHDLDFDCHDMDPYRHDPNLDGHDMALDRDDRSCVYRKLPIKTAISIPLDRMDRIFHRRER